MSEKTGVKVHWSFWVIGVAGLLFNLMGCINFVSQMNAETVASMPDVYRAIVEARPSWGTGAFDSGQCLYRSVRWHRCSSDTVCRDDGLARCSMDRLARSAGCRRVVDLVFEMDSKQRLDQLTTAA